MILALLALLALPPNAPPIAAPDTVAPRPILLDSGWSVRAGDDATWALADAGDEPGWIPVAVPGPMEEALGTYDGFAWYRRVIHLPEPLATGPLGVDFGTVGDAFEVYWNGVRVGSSGSLPPRFLDSPPLPGPFLVPQHALSRSEGGTHLLAVRVYNEYLYGGLLGGVVIGRYDTLVTPQRNDPEVVIAVILGFFAAVGLYHLIFWIRRPRALENLLFAGLCTLVGIYGATHSSLFGEWVVEWVNPFRLGVVVTSLAGVVFVLLAYRLFELRPGRGELALIGVYLAGAAAAAVVPLRTLGEWVLFLDLAIVAGLVGVAGLLVRRAARGAARQRWLLLTGTLLFAASIVWDLLSEYVLPVPDLLPGMLTGAIWLGFLAFTATVGVVTASRWAVAEATALTDPLTGLSRRHVLEEALLREAERLRRTGGSVALVVLDLDHFKQVNDTYGHRTGDEVLARMGTLLRRTSRNIDLPARMGGEEFAVLLYDSGLEGARVYAERLRSYLGQLEVPVPGGMLRVTASMGVAAGGDLLDGDALLDAADRALYQAKREGRDRVVSVVLGSRTVDRQPT
jgi:diguanylate cyclase (GGDEF)-like protein